jgi:DNA polymerase V
MQPLIALVDCNNFYASCERLFRPDLHNKPIAVLSNNDGCIVARSAEVKALGIKMGIPVFKAQHLIGQHQVQLFSSNYSLYADMSARVMTILEEFTPGLEIYSIDEALLDLTGVCNQDPVAYGQRIRQTKNRETGIPVCVGIGPTKTLAKLANFAAKKWKKTGGVLDLSDPVRRGKLMKIVPVSEVWGIGSRTAVKLNQLGIRTVWDLASQPSKQIQAQFSVAVARTVMELNGIACLAIEEIAPDKQQIVCSRSFRHGITTFDALMMAIARFCARAAEKLRWQHLMTRRLSVFIRTSPFKSDEPYYERIASRQLLIPSQDTRYLVAVSRQLMEVIFKPGYAYQKAGVQLDDFQSIQQATCQQDLFSLSKPDEERLNNVKLMAEMDLINQRFPKSVILAAAGLAKSLGSDNDYLSQVNTTHWEELPKVKC